jgi:hypothetical protein
MRQISGLSVCLALLFLPGCAVLPGLHVHGKEPQSDPLRTLPPQIQAATTCAQLEPFAKSADEKTRRAAVRRLGQIGGDDAVDMIVRAYQSEPPFPGDSLSRGVKQEGLHALSSIRSAKAKQAVLDLVVPVMRSGRGRIEGGELNTLAFGMDALVTWADDRAVQHFFREIATEGKYADRLPYQLQEKAYEGYLECEMASNGIVGVEAQVKYLADQLTEAGVGHSYDWTKSGKTQDAIRNSARRGALVRLGPPAEPLIRARLASLPAQDEERRQALTKVLGAMANKAYAETQAANPTAQPSKAH